MAFNGWRTQKMRLFRVFMITSLLIAGIPRLAAAAVGAKSLQGLFSSDECEVAPELLGAWTSNGVTYSLRESHHNKYWMIDRDADLKTGNKLVLEICVAHIAGQLFYDATFQILGPGDQPTLPPAFVVGTDVFAVDIVARFWVPMHIIGKLEIEQNKLHFRNLDNEWLQVALKSRLITVPSAQDDSGEYLLTANGKQLKAFVASLSTDPKAFSEQQGLSRIPGRTPNSTP
jgi:hypothetical protein